MLADRLGVSQLVEQCLSKLANETGELVDHALFLDLTLQQVLFGAEDINDNKVPAIAPVGNVAQVVVLHVLKDDKCPKRLLDLVVKLLTQQTDQKLWGMLRHLISHSTALLLIDAVLRGGQVKVEDSDIKSETDALG